jgi:ribosome-associated translation inhibitor RaiA
MQIQFNTDSNIHGTDDLAARVEGMVAGALERFSEQITRVEIHLSDVNSQDKAGDDDKRCVLEVRLAGRQPIAVTHQAANVQQAVTGATDKMKSALDTTLGRLRDK